MHMIPRCMVVMLLLLIILAKFITTCFRGPLGHRLSLTIYIPGSHKPLLDRNPVFMLINLQNAGSTHYMYIALSVL